jgi:hypothetical protein
MQLGQLDIFFSEFDVEESPRTPTLAILPWHYTSGSFVMNIAIGSCQNRDVNAATASRGSRRSQVNLNCD